MIENIKTLCRDLEIIFHVYTSLTNRNSLSLYCNFYNIKLNNKDVWENFCILILIDFKLILIALEKETERIFFYI